MYLLYYVAISSVKKKGEKDRTMSLFNYAAIGTVKREKSKKVTGTVVYG